MDKKSLKILNEYWGYDSFRPLQEEIIQSVLNGKDTLALMPTGGGKSITFQVPALVLDGLCLVITPLVALMKDQVASLQKRGVKAMALYTGLTAHEIQQTINACLYGNVKLLYISPERLEGNAFRHKLAGMPISLIAVDEAHCISQWGYDFRPSYLQINRVRELFPDVPVLAVTATATEKVVADIQKQLDFKNPNVFKKSFERTNLSYLVRKTEDKLQYLLRILNHSEGSAIVYVRSRAKTKQISDFLNENGIQSTFFHAGLSDYVKSKRQLEWTHSKVRTIVATNAFGMGIDKADVRTVVHMDLPDSIEAYFQEAGRAGRDGLPSYAILLYHPQDRAQLKKRIAQNYPKKKIILRTYSAVCNFLKIPEGYAKGASYPLDIPKLATNFKLSIIHTYSSLSILRNADVLDFVEELNNPSRILFLMRRDELYDYQSKHLKAHQLIQALLRMYTGVFTDYAKINEHAIADKINISAEETKDLLLLLSKQKVINYIPRLRSPYVSFPDGRIPESHILLNKSIYKNRKKFYEKQIKAILYYAESKYRCRSQMLLAYFNDFSGKPCGQCDVCLKHKKATHSSENIRKTKSKIMQTLQNPMQIKELELHFEDTKLFHHALHELLNDETVKLSRNQMIEKK